MSKRLVQCNTCKNKFDKEELIQVNKSTRICAECDAKKKKDALEYKELIKYMCDGFRLDRPTGQQLKSIKKFKELGYSYADIQYTLYYIFFVERKQVYNYSIELVPYYYLKAMEHKRLINNAKRTAKKLATEEVVIVTGKSTQKPNLKNTRLVDIENLF